MALTAAEEALRALLERHRLLVSSRDGGVAGAPGTALLSVARGSGGGGAASRDESRATLLHEAMHGLFYAHPPFAAACTAFWNDSLDEPRRGAWRAFLAALGYDVANEELVVNEFQAYMCTERQLFGGGSGGKGKQRDGGGGGAADVALLAAMQRAFAPYVAPHVPAPAPRLAGCACVFADPAFCAAGGAGGPFRLK